jgi:hypothetical protein
VRFYLVLFMACTVLSLGLAYQRPTASATPTPVALGSIEGSVHKKQYPPYPGIFPLAGWTVLLGRDFTLIAKAQADAEGVYRFDDVAAGEYMVQLSFEQPEGQGWELLSPPDWANSNCRSERITVSVEGGQVAAGPEFTVRMLDDVRGFFGKVFNDLDEDGERDPEEPGFQCSLRQVVGNVIWIERTDLDGNFRYVREEPIDEERLALTSCPQYPDAPKGYRVTTPRPGPCGRNGCVTRTDEQVYRCEDFGLHLVDEEGAYFRGSMWENAAPVAPGSVVSASIGDTVCGQGYVWDDTWDGRTRYEVIVRSEQARAGCGTEGAKLGFSLDGRDIPTLGRWQEGEQSLDLVIGPPFAEFDVRLEVPGFRSYWGKLIQAYIGEVLCGEARGRTAGMCVYTSFTLVVLPDSLRPGCGRQGDVIRFVLDGRPLSQTATWSPGKHTLKLTMVPLGPPDTGSGVLSDRGDGLPLAAGFALLGVAAACGVAGLALRRSAGRER